MKFRHFILASLFVFPLYLQASMTKYRYFVSPFDDLGLEEQGGQSFDRLWSVKAKFVGHQDKLVHQIVLELRGANMDIEYNFDQTFAKIIFSSWEERNPQEGSFFPFLPKSSLRVELTNLEQAENLNRSLKLPTAFSITGANATIFLDEKVSEKEKLDALMHIKDAIFDMKTQRINQALNVLGQIQYQLNTGMFWDSARQYNNFISKENWNYNYHSGWTGGQLLETLTLQFLDADQIWYTLVIRNNRSLNVNDIEISRGFDQLNNLMQKIVEVGKEYKMLSTNIQFNPAEGSNSEYIDLSGYAYFRGGKLGKTVVITEKIPSTIKEMIIVKSGILNGIPEEAISKIRTILDWKL